jgi:hypothetical protein
MILGGFGLRQPTSRGFRLAKNANVRGTWRAIFHRYISQRQNRGPTAMVCSNFDQLRNEANLSLRKHL